MIKKCYEAPKIELSYAITDDFMTTSDEIIILPPHEFNIY